MKAKILLAVGILVAGSVVMLILSQQPKKQDTPPAPKSLPTVSILLPKSAVNQKPTSKNVSVTTVPLPTPTIVQAAPTSIPFGTVSGETRILIILSQNVLPIGDTRRISIQIENVAGLYGAEIHLRFDPKKLQVEDADPALPGVQVQPGDLLDPKHGMVILNAVDNATGTIDYAAILTNPAPPVTGSGPLASVLFKGTGLGASSIVFTPTPAAPAGILLSDRKGTAIAAQAQSGTITVQ